jgi:hypothetical protein
MLTNYLSWDSLGSEQVGRNGKKMLHPFASLKALYNDLGATQQIMVNTEEELFKVNDAAFINAHYPVTTVNSTGLNTTQANVTWTYNGVIPSQYVSVKSVAELGMNFILQPEITQSGCDVTFTKDLWQDLFNT